MNAIAKMYRRQATDRYRFFQLRPAPGVLAGLESAGFTRCTPIQAMTLPISCRARRRRPGPDRHRQDPRLPGHPGEPPAVAPALANRGPADPRAMILAPTRELAIQIHKDAEKFGRPRPEVRADLRRRRLRQAARPADLGCDVIIATPAA
jgi:superfamily II DNA/RNA helicase